MMMHDPRLRQLDSIQQHKMKHFASIYEGNVGGDVLRSKEQLRRHTFSTNRIGVILLVTQRKGASIYRGLY